MPFSFCIRGFIFFLHQRVSPIAPSHRAASRINYIIIVSHYAFSESYYEPVVSNRDPTIKPPVNRETGLEVSSPSYWGHQSPSPGCHSPALLKQNLGVRDPSWLPLSPLPLAQWNRTLNFGSVSSAPREEGKSLPSLLQVRPPGESCHRIFIASPGEAQ